MGLRIGNSYDGSHCSTSVCHFPRSLHESRCVCCRRRHDSIAKPGKSDPYFQMGSSATSLALADAGLAYAAVQQAYVGYVYGDSTAGQRALYEVGMSGIPIINVNNNCSTGSTALFLARQAVASGAADCVLALGFEQMTPGALGSVFSDRPSPFDRFEAETDALVGDNGVPLALRYFGGAGKAHMDQYGTQLSTLPRSAPGQSPCGAQSTGPVPRRGDGRSHGLPVMWPGVMTRLMACPPPARGGGPAGVRSLCAQAWPGPQRAHPRPVHDHGQPQNLRGPRHARSGGLQHGTGRCAPGL